MDWKGKRVFLTGHTGFKGSWLSLWLQQKGAVVRGYALDPPGSASLFEAADVAIGMESHIGDIRDQAGLQCELTSFQPEIVFHMAAQPLVRLSYRQPLETYAINVMGTANLLEAVRLSGTVRAVVIVTTDKCYENREWLWPYRETDRLGGHDPYSSSKAAAELVTASYRSSFFPPAEHARHGVAIASARAGNVIGGGDWAFDRLIPDIMRAFDAGEVVRLRHPHATRPWQHVLEPLRGYMLLAEALFEHGPRFGEAWNFGPRDLDAVPVHRIVETVAEHWGPGARWELDQPEEGKPHVHEAALLRLDWSKALHHLHWRPLFSLDDALRFTIEWYAVSRRERKMRDTTLQQIEHYQELASRVN